MYFNFNASMPLQLLILHSLFFNFALTKSPGIFFLLKFTIPTAFIPFSTKVKNSFGEEYQLSIIYTKCVLYVVLTLITPLRHFQMQYNQNLFNR